MAWERLLGKDINIWPPGLRQHMSDAKVSSRFLILCKQLNETIQSKELLHSTGNFVTSAIWRAINKKLS